MYFVPLSQMESVELVIHSLRAAGGEVDCRQCPVYRVCSKQCLTIADAIEKMLQSGTLPQLGGEPEVPPAKGPGKDPEPPGGGSPAGKVRFKVVK